LPTTKVYVRLLDEGTDVARPTEAEVVSDGVYRLLPTPDYDSEVEKWEFLPGELVRCPVIKLVEGDFLGVVARA
jgi:hypothetical protein